METFGKFYVNIYAYFTAPPPVIPSLITLNLLVVFLIQFKQFLMLLNDLE